MRENLAVRKYLRLQYIVSLYWFIRTFKWYESWILFNSHVYSNVFVIKHKMSEWKKKCILEFSEAMRSCTIIFCEFLIVTVGFQSNQCHVGTTY